MFIEILKYIQVLFKKNYKSALWGILLTPLFFLFICTIFSVNILDLTNFLLSKNYQLERNKVTQELQSINQQIEEYEWQSYKNQKKIWKILEDDLIDEKVDNVEEITEILEKSNTNQDAIRSLLEFGKIYTVFVENNLHTPKLQEHLVNLYKAFLYILRLEPELYCTRIIDNLDDIHKNIDDFPKFVRDNVHIEILRYLSYCAAKLERTNQQGLYTNYADKIMKNDQYKPAKEYRLKYYWIDLSKLILSINNGEVDDAEKIFRSLRDNLGDYQFLRIKLLQHEPTIKQIYKAQWKEFIEDLK